MSKTAPDKLKLMQEESKKRHPLSEVVFMEVKKKNGKEVVPDLPKEIKRPEAVYTNLPSAYGIWTEIANEQLKKSG